MPPPEPAPVRPDPRNKVPAVTAAFWAIKICATTVGETAADLLSTRLGLGAAGTGAVMAGLLALLLAAQMRAWRYVPWLYWATVVLVSIAGTLLTDFLTDGLSVSLAYTTAGFTLTLAGIFILWHRSERTLSIHTIVTTRREAFYWAAILATFALGTATGDLMAERLQLGYALSAVVFLVLLAGTGVAWFTFAANPVATFWIAYVLTRPFGAACGDWLAQPADAGGLALGPVTTSAGLLGVIVLLVSLATVARLRRAGNIGQAYAAVPAGPTASPAASGPAAGTVPPPNRRKESGS